MIPDMKIFHHR